MWSEISVENILFFFNNMQVDISIKYFSVTWSWKYICLHYNVLIFSTNKSHFAFDSFYKK